MYGEDELSAFKESIFGEKEEEREEGSGEDEGVEAVSLTEDAAEEDRNTPPESAEAVAEAPESVKVSAVPPASGARREEHSDDSLAAANGMISKGDYAGALNIYEKILSANQGDRKVMQRMEELRSFLKMTGKDKDAVLISRLNAFLEGVKKRRDGFLGST